MKTPNEIASRVHVETIDVFSKLNILQSLAKMHVEALSGQCSDSDRDDLVMGAHRTLFLAAELCRYRVKAEFLDEAAAEKIANEFVSESGIRNIVDMICGSIPFSCSEPMKAVSRESATLFLAATMFDKLLRQNRPDKAFEVWRACAKGSYSELPTIY